MYTHKRTHIGVPQRFSKITLSRSKAENKGCHSVLVAPRQCRWNKAQRGVGGLHPHTAPLSTVIQQGGRPNMGSETRTRIAFLCWKCSCPQSSWMPSLSFLKGTVANVQPQCIALSKWPRQKWWVNEFYGTIQLVNRVWSFSFLIFSFLSFPPEY